MSGNGCQEHKTLAAGQQFADSPGSAKWMVRRRLECAKNVHSLSFYWVGGRRLWGQQVALPLIAQHDPFGGDGFDKDGAIDFLAFEVFPAIDEGEAFGRRPRV